MSYYGFLPEKPSGEDIALAIMIKMGRTRSMGSAITRQLADHTIPEICRESLFWNGEYAPENDPDAIRSAFSSGILPAAVNTAIGSQVVSGFAEQQDSTTGWTAELELQDYKLAPVLQARDSHVLTPAPKGGRADHSIVNVAELAIWKLAKLARQLLIDEMDLTDDAFGAIATSARQLGAAAKRARLDLVYHTLLLNAAMYTDGILLFHEDHGNLATGPTSALNTTSLAAGMSAVRSQIADFDTTTNAIHLNLQPKYLIVPPELEGTARATLRLLKLDDPGMDLELRVESRIGITPVYDYSGDGQVGSATNWFLAAAATPSPSVCVGIMEGQREPIIREFSLSNHGQWGRGWDVSYSVCCAVVDHRGLYRSDGA